MSVFLQTNECVNYTATGEAATLNVATADSGKTFLIPALGAAHALTINLPLVDDGLRYRFMAIDTLASIVTLTPTDGANSSVPYTPVNGLVNGTLFNLPNGAAISIVSKAAANTASLTATATVGSFIDVNSDGNAWYITGMSGVAAGLS